MIEFNLKDFDEAKDLVALQRKIDNLTPETVEQIGDAIFLYQPFILHLALEYRELLSPRSLDEVLKAYFLIWEYYRHEAPITKRKLSEEVFEQSFNERVNLLKSFEKEDAKQKNSIVTQDTQLLASKALYAVVIDRWLDRQGFIEIDGKLRSVIMLEMRTLIDCLDDLVAGKI